MGETSGQAVLQISSKQALALKHSGTLVGTEYYYF